MTEHQQKGALAGLTVVDLTRVLAGPYATMVLANLGARVIKVEHPTIGDDARRFGPFVGGESAYFQSLNHGKELLQLDLNNSADRGAFEDLLEEADVLVENFRTGVMESLGYSWDTLQRQWPRLIYAAVSGFGHTGPYANRPAYDLIVQAMSGLMSITGHPQSPPTRVGTSIGDITAGLFAVIGILAALEDRHHTGQGQKVDISMLDCQVAILENAIARQSAGNPPAQLGSRHPSITPFSAFKAADQWIVIAAGNNQLYANLCHALHRPDLIDNKLFQTNRERTKNHLQLAAEIESALASNTARAWLEKLEEAGVPCAPINNIEAVISDPAVRARHMIVPISMPDGSILEVAGNPIKLSAHLGPKR